jgi:hypothetical protein
MSDQFYPLDLPGITWNRVRKPHFKNSVFEALSGAEVRVRHRFYPKHDLELKYNFLREKTTHTEMQRLVGFFESHGGTFESFLFADPADSVAQYTQFGIGDGTQTYWQLVRSMGAFSEPVHNVGLVDIGRVWFPQAGDAVAFWPQQYGWPDADIYEPVPGGFTLLPNGIIRFSVAPPVGKLLLWSGHYYYRSRFGDDTLDVNEFMHQLYSLGKVKLVRSLQNIL